MVSAVLHYLSPAILNQRPDLLVIDAMYGSHGVRREWGKV